MTINFSEIELRKLDLNLLLVFTAIMRTGSGSAAAQRLYLAPSAVSMALGRLRRALGDDLFVRGKNGLEPTEGAKALYMRVAPALETISSAVTDGRGFDPRTSQRTFRLGLSDDLEQVLVPEVVRQLAAAAPSTSLILRAADYRTVADLLSEADLDLGITAAPLRLTTSHRSEVLYSETFSALWNPGVLKLPDPLTLSVYLATPQALVSAVGSRVGVIDAALEKLGAGRQVSNVVERFSTLPLLLQTAPLLGNVPSRLARSFAVSFNLTFKPLPFDSPQFDVAATWHVRANQDAALVWFRNLVRDVIASG